MEKASPLPFSYTAKSYFLLAKPGIILGNVMTTAAGFALASARHFDIFSFLAVLIGLSFLIGSSCIVNNYIDRQTDAKMTRTKTRALATGAISPKKALFFSLILGVMGTFVLFCFTNLLTMAVALFGFLVYVAIYTFSKYYSVHGTLIGSVAGAVPPVAGYCAGSNHLDLGAWIFFMILVFWQMPHFFAIAIYRIEDYRKASIPVLPISKGILRTKLQMIGYILAFLLSSSALTLCGYTNMTFLAVSCLIGILWLFLSLQGFWAENDQIWARQVFRFSLFVITVQSGLIPFSIC